MQRRIVSLLATGALVSSLGVLVAPGVALAEAPPVPAPPAAVVAPEAPVPVINPTSGPPGTVISVTVPGCEGFVTAALGNQDGEILAFEEGPAPTVNLTVPADTPQGEIAVVAGCNVYAETDINGVIFTVTAAAVVAQPHVTG